jgi:hypothetical protein
MDRFFVLKPGRKDRQKENGKQKIHLEIYHPNGVSPASLLSSLMLISLQ